MIPRTNTLGLRFSGGVDTTVKLCSNLVYRFQMSSSPAVVLT
jgi:hypothetical protein